MTVEQAINSVQKMLVDAWPDRPEYGIVRLYTWGAGLSILGNEYEGDTPTSDLPRHEAVGFRVAEVSFEAIDPKTGRGGGSTFMQTDMGAAEACLFAERCVIARIEGWPDEEAISEDWRLLAVTLGEDVADDYAEAWRAEL